MGLLRHALVSLPLAACLAAAPAPDPPGSPAAGAPPVGAGGAAGADPEGLLASERNTIGIFQRNVRSVVNVSNIRLARRGLFDQEAQVPAGTGSGWVWDREGHIVTNFHVVAGGDRFLVTFHKDKTQYPAVVRGTAPMKDIAVLKLEALPPGGLAPAAVGRSGGLVVGQKAMALGNPFGLDHSISAGIISALGRKMTGVGGVTIEDMIQTDTSINVGNSGGPLLDSSGRVIGVNTMILSRSGASSGVGFAVPIDTVGRIVPQLIEHGEVVRPGLGIVLLGERFRDFFDVKEGVIVKHVDPEHPAHAAGMKGITQDRRGRYYLGDVILSIDGQKVGSYDDIYHVLDKKKVGDAVSVEVRRGGEDRTRTINSRLIKL